MFGDMISPVTWSNYYTCGDQLDLHYSSSYDGQKTPHSTDTNPKPVLMAGDNTVVKTRSLEIVLATIDASAQAASITNNAHSSQQGNDHSDQLPTGPTTSLVPFPKNVEYCNPGDNSTSTENVKRQTNSTTSVNTTALAEKPADLIRISV
jgi:hypothetical protein